MVELLPDLDQPRAFIVLLDGAPQSYVDLDDPTNLAFEYVRHLADVIDLATPEGTGLDILHLGGGGLSLPRYIATTRPRSRQRVVEIDPGLIELIREHLPLERTAQLKITTGDAREVITRTKPGSLDMVVSDVYAGTRVPAHLTSIEYVNAAARVLRPDGLYLANITDGQPLSFARSQVATVSAVFEHVYLIAEASVLRGRRFGNLVIAAGARSLPVPELARRLSSGSYPARIEHSERLAQFAGSAPVVHDVSATDSPEPPSQAFQIG